MALIKPNISNADNSTLVLLAMILDNLSPGGTGIDYTGNFNDLVNNQNTIYQHISERAGVKNKFSVHKLNMGDSISIPANACSGLEVIPRSGVTYDISIDGDTTSGLDIPLKLEFDYRNDQSIQIDATVGVVNVIQRF